MFLLFTFVPNFCTNVFFVPDLTNPTFLCWSLFHVLRNICSLFFNFCSYFLVPSVLFLPSNFSYAQSFIFVSCVKNYVPSSLIFVPNSCFLNFFLIYYMLTVPIFVPFPNTVSFDSKSMSQVLNFVPNSLTIFLLFLVLASSLFLL